MNILKRHKLLKIVSLNALSVGAQFVLGIFSVRIVSEFLGPNGMALTGNFRSFTSLFKSVSVMGLKEGLINQVTTTADKKEKDNKNSFHNIFWFTKYRIKFIAYFH